MPSGDVVALRLPLSPTEAAETLEAVELLAQEYEVNQNNPEKAQPLWVVSRRIRQPLGEGN